MFYALENTLTPLKTADASNKITAYDWTVTTYHRPRAIESQFISLCIESLTHGVLAFYLGPSSKLWSEFIFFLFVKTMSFDSNI